VTHQGPIQLLPRIPPSARFALAAIVVAMLVYVMASLEQPPVAQPDDDPVPTIVAVPELDRQILAGAQDATREQRLAIEVEPLRHLLSKSIDVGPSVASALGAPDRPVPVAEVRDNLATMRLRWLWYEGVLEELSGPREGHPVRNYSIYEATVRLADGNHVLATFSIPPPEGVKAGDWVRVDGYLLKLRDTTYPRAIERAPMLVGRAMQRDYEDWPPVTVLDPNVFAKVDDRSAFPGDPMWRTVEEDQDVPLWHLAAYARDTAASRTLADWRAFPVLNAHDHHEKLKDHEVPRGTPIRIVGPLIQRTSMAAPSNPAGISSWTVAWIQVREFGGHVIPVWVPKRVDIATRAQLEVRGYYYRWLAYETNRNRGYRIPLFVAADLDLYQLETGAAMREIGLWIGGSLTLFLVLLLWSQHRTARSSLEHSRAMDARRRRRRERTSTRKSLTTPSS